MDILEKFYENKEVKITDDNGLYTYIKYCLEKQLPEKIKGKSAYHHILPKKLFPYCSDLKKFNWNGVHLLYKDHYIAHSMLHDATSNISISYAWFAMNFRDKNTKNINGIELLGADKHQLLMEKRSKIASNYQKGKMPWNKGLTKETDTRVKRQSINQISIKKSEEHKLKLSKSRKGKVNVLDIRDNTNKIVSQEDFDNYPEIYKGHNYGKSLGSGAKNSQAKLRYIIDEHSIIRYEVNGNFNEICEKNNLPKTSLYNTLKSKKGIKSKKFISFNGWKLIDNN